MLNKTLLAQFQNFHAKLVRIWRVLWESKSVAEFSENSVKREKNVDKIWNEHVVIAVMDITTIEFINLKNSHLNLKPSDK